jgi:hypothetical protein
MKKIHFAGVLRNCRKKTAVKWRVFCSDQESLLDVKQCAIDVVGRIKIDVKEFFYFLYCRCEGV